ncbi:MAG: serine hydrolase domain-containing protein [Anaerolineae bacterium]
MSPVDSSAFERDLDAFVAPFVGTVFPSMALAVFHRGDCILNRAWGFNDPDGRMMPTTVDTRFDFASLTKLFTTTAVLSLIDEGRLRLDTRLIDVIPEFGAQSPRPISGGQDPHTRIHLPTPPERSAETVDPAAVTIFHLLTHTSGLPPWSAVFEAAGAIPLPPDQVDPVPRAERWNRAIAAICGLAFVGQPGEAVRYSDMGFMLLGETLRRLGGVSAADDGLFAPILRQRVFEPLQLATIGYLPMRAGIRRDQIAPTEYDSMWRQRRVWGEVHDENACGAGGISSHAGLFGTALDVARFGQAWLRGTVPGLSAALVADAVREHTETGGERRGLGWMIRSRVGSSAGQYFSDDAYGHTGFVGNSLWIDPEQQLVVACMSNRVYYGRANDGIIAFRKALHDGLWQRLCGGSA